MVGSCVAQRVTDLSTLGSWMESLLGTGDSGCFAVLGVVVTMLLLPVVLVLETWLPLLQILNHFSCAFRNQTTSAGNAGIVTKVFQS